MLLSFSTQRRPLNRLAVFCAFVLLLVPSVLRAETVALTEAMRRDFGAASWVPENAGYFSTGLRYGEQWNAFRDSRACQQLLATPGATMALMWFQQQPYLAQLEAARQQNPLIDRSVKLAEDAFAHEVFFYLDQRGPKFADAFGELYGKLMWSGLVDGWEQNQPGGISTVEQLERREQLVRQALAMQDELRVPGIVFGFRLSDPQLGQEWMNTITPFLQQLIPVPLQKQAINGGDYLTLSLRLKDFLSPQDRLRMEQEMAKGQLDPLLAAQVFEWIESQTISFAVGMRDEYLLISIGADHSHLEEFDRGTSLAESDALDPVRRVFRDDLVNLSYVDADLTSSGKIDVADTVSGIESLLLNFDGFLPEGMNKRVIADAERMLREFNTHLPEAEPTVAVSFWNRGYESYQFSALAPGSLKSSQPLGILAKAGLEPLMAVGSNSAPFLPHYQRFEFWLKNWYAHGEELLKYHLNAEDKESFDELRALALPALRSFSEVNRELLIPSLDGGQSLLMMDANGMVTHSPKDRSALPQAIRFPRPAFVCEVQDAEKLVEACAQYRETFNRLMNEVALKSPSVQPVQLPPASKRPLGEGILYTYSIPEAYHPAPYMNNDFEPHALLTDTHLVLSLSTKQSVALLESTSVPASDLIDFDQPAGRVVWFDFTVLTNLLGDDVDAVLTLLGTEQEIEPTTAMMVKVHVDGIRRALGAVRSYQSRTYEEAGRQVTHSWLHLQDIE